jgi:hypothetical protein
MKTLNQLTKKYRSQIRSKMKIQEQINDLRQQERALQDKGNALGKEMDFTKTLIDYCVLTGETPAEALLKNTKEQIRSTIDNMSGFSPLIGGSISGLTVSNNLVTITNTGNITSSGLLTLDPNQSAWSNTVYTPTNTTLSVNSAQGSTRVGGSGRGVPGV